MDLFKLDKYDKYFVSFILIIITLFNIGQCFASDIETVGQEVVRSLYMSNDQNYFSSGNQKYFLFSN